ncbi:hypothetical protein L6452_07463 [Arctium lappa]|uniref:Uncharacterized protein n=1 Tax=Arctium lappa TaxID=4217 RepID=A0ACB9EKN4_ARCLA|nr:hypothetical protein L6452_07463 [Arctium lappa]
MAAAPQLPCNADGVCMLCKDKPQPVEKVMCITCVTPWHVSCLTTPPDILTAAVFWVCPDCTINPVGGLTNVLGPVGENADLVAAVRRIVEDPSLTESEKAKRRQDLMSGAIADHKGKGKMAEDDEDDDDDERTESDSDINIVDIEDDEIRCAICLQSPEKPVTTPCGHNFCLKCFEKWMSKGKPNCPKCRCAIPSTVARNPRVNLILAKAIREAKVSISEQPQKTSSQTDRPGAAFTTERAKKPGLANASSGRILVTVPRDHFGPITAENDPERNQGVLVGENWKSRMEVRQWGVHFAHISGISGQSKNGAQSVVLSGGYADDEDHGDWFLYTGSGGRDLTGNRRTNKKQSSDQHFTKCNESLRLSCKKGYPIRVVRAYKNKRSVYSPQEGYRYDGIYRIERCWRKLGVQGFLICRYLFIRCDNEPAPWMTSDNAHGDLPRVVPDVPELREAIDVCEREETPSWDFDEVEACWVWKKPPPPSKTSITNGVAQKRKRRNNKQSFGLFDCVLCKQMMTMPLTTACGHSFCKSCLEARFVGQSSMRDRSGGGRTLRLQKKFFKCPAPECSDNISDFLDNPQVNTELAGLIEKLQSGREKNVKASELSDGGEEEMVEVEALDESDDEEEA